MLLYQIRKVEVLLSTPQDLVYKLGLTTTIQAVVRSFPSIITEIRINYWHLVDPKKHRFEAAEAHQVTSPQAAILFVAARLLS